jgi:CMP-N-acetylneuraminic acid synthetase
MIQFLALIPARGGSKGVPRKNIRLVGNKPLLAWTIEAANESELISRTVVSTEDPEIAEIAQQYGAEVPCYRPDNLAEDTSDTLDAVLYTLDFLEKKEGYIPDYVVLLQPTSPLRRNDDIDAAIRFTIEHNADSVVSICEAKPHPLLSKTLTQNGTMMDFIPGASDYSRRQDFPEVYSLNGALYINRISSLKNARKFILPNTYGYIMPEERSLDIDTPFDLFIADLILTHSLYEGRITPAERSL